MTTSRKGYIRDLLLRLVKSASSCCNKPTLIHLYARNLPFHSGVHDECTELLGCSWRLFTRVHSLSNPSFLCLCLHACHFFIPSLAQWGQPQNSAGHSKPYVEESFIPYFETYMGLSQPFRHQLSSERFLLQVNQSVFGNNGSFLKSCWSGSRVGGGRESLMGAQLHLASGFFSHEVHRQYTITFREKSIIINRLPLQVWERRGGGRWKEGDP